MFYNADLFRQAGLDPNQPPTTIDGIKSAALAIKSKTGAQGAYLAAVDPGKSDYFTQSLIDSNGGHEIGPDGSPTFDQPPAVQALAAVQDLTKSGAQPAVTATSAIAAFTSGKLGMLVGSTAVAASLQKAATGHFELRSAGFPSFGTTPATPTWSGAGLAVLSKDPAHQQAAWDFIKFLTSDQGFTIITSQIGYLPLRPALATDPQYLQPYFSTNKLLSPGLAQLDQVTPYQSFPGQHGDQAVVALQDDAVTPIVLQGADPPSTLTAEAGKVRGILSP
jgi:multiple sugar transport system substrate-binding protein